MKHGRHVLPVDRRARALMTLLAAILLCSSFAPAFAPPARAQSAPDSEGLTKAGPVNPQTGYPYWYEDANGVRLDLCLDPADQKCVQPFEMPNPEGPVSFPDNFPGESFWWLGEASTTTEGGGDALLSLATEAAWGGPNEAVRDGEQISFGRIRIRVDGLDIGSTYRVTHPYGVQTFVAEDDGKGAGEINFTEDLGCGVGALKTCDFDEILAGNVGPFLSWDTFGQGTDPALAGANGDPDAYVGDPNVPHAVQGSPTGNNFFLVEEQDATGNWVEVARQDQFTISGKVAVPQVEASHRDTLFNSAQQIELIPSDESYNVHYTTDGTEPTTGSPVYEAPITVDAEQGTRQDTTLKFMAVDPATDRQSQVVEKTYTVDRAAPHLISNVPGGTYEDLPDNDGDGSPDKLELSIEQDPDDPTNVRTADIVYTTDGSTPEVSRAAQTDEQIANGEPGDLQIANGKLYTEPMDVSRSTTVKAVAIDDAGNESRVETFDYKIAALKAVGPINPQGGYPYWYEDKNGVRLELCLDPADQKCVQPLEMPNPEGPVSFPDNFPGESFWWTGEADLGLPGSDKSILVMAHEAAWGGADEAVRDGDQIVFGRIRVRIDGLQVGEQYRVTHPYGTDTYIAEDDGKGGGEINVTEDLGCGELGSVATCDFNEARFGRVGPFLSWDTFGQGTDPALAGANGEADAYVGDPNVPHAVQGSPMTDGEGNPQNYFKLEHNDGGNWRTLGQTDQFSVSGKVAGLEATPSVQGGNFTEAQQVALTANDPDAAIVFTTDGTDPEVSRVGAAGADTGGLALLNLFAALDPGSFQIVNGQEYTGPITIEKDTELRYIVVTDSKTSDVFSQRYVIDAEAPSVSATPDAGTYGKARSVTLKASEPAKIYYTTDGSEPTTDSQVFDSPIEVSKAQTIRAFAVDEAGNRGDTASFEYDIQARSALALNASASTLKFGQTTVLSGKLTSDGKALAGKRVILQHKPHGAQSFKKLPGQPAAGVLTNAGGNYRLADVKPSRNTVYRASFTGGEGLKKSLSPTKQVKVRTVLTNATSTKQIKPGQSKAIAGQVRPAHTGTVKVVVKRGTQVVLTKNLKLTNSRYRFIYRPKATGTYRVQVTMAAHADHLAGASPIKSFRVSR